MSHGLKSLGQLRLTLASDASDRSWLPTDWGLRPVSTLGLPADARQCTVHHCDGFRPLMAIPGAPSSVDCISGGRSDEKTMQSHHAKNC